MFRDASMKNSVVAGLLILLALAFALARMTSSTDTAQPESRYIDAQEPTDPPATAEATIGTATASATSPIRTPQFERLPDPASLEAAKAARIAQLEDKVASEPVSAAWATANAGRIRAFLQADKLRAAQLPAVDHAAVDCRTTICRIELRTQDSLAAGELTQGILHTISEQMPTAQIFEKQGAVGTTLLIFSTAGATQQGEPFRPKR
jgi:hypothetical protein